ncbi:hypothetical protein EDC96DRAFT_452939 [Choanephora cucurbitarum]|nr:hypothetical protein EDC96DRAFT_452939 [Choanephora cucurbitarum]
MFGRKPVLPQLNGEVTTSFKTYTAESWYHHLNHYLPILHNQIQSQSTNKSRASTKILQQEQKIQGSNSCW